MVGLTPPAWQDNSGVAALDKIQHALYQFYSKAIQFLKPINLHIRNGDAIDGRGERSGGLEQLVPNRAIQVGMAVDSLIESEAVHYGLTIGTPYHTGDKEQWDRAIARELELRGYSVSVGGHEWYTVGGVTFDCKHKVGASQIPHGRSTAIKREQLWNAIWAERGTNPRADVVVRSHVHYFDYTGGPDGLAVVTPALQGQGSRYGVLQCSGTVDFGLLWFDTLDRRIVDWGWILADYRIQKTETIVI